MSDELFQGQLPIREAIQRLRIRLLDLSARNRLLNYKHPKRRCIQFVAQPDLDLLFERLTDARSIGLAYVPEPDAAGYERGKKPEARQYARELGIDTSVEFLPPARSNAGHRRLPPLQTLYYPPDLEKLLRKIAAEAKTVIEETGSNMLYLTFGFLEFYDSDDSDRPMLAPLLSVPVVLNREAIDQISRTYQYSLAYSGEDIAENPTLREKLKQDFRLQLPEFEDEDTPESYFGHIARAIRTKQRWKVRRQLTLGFLSFGKLAIWADLDPEKWPALLEHPLLKKVFEGNGNSDDCFHAEDYVIDRHEQGNIPLIYDADSSQHSALIDALSGKDMVINGPPGTGKSQTITNIIASALVAGKKVLFVSEKLAALEVVRGRLEKAHLGHFCLELHSHKTQKKKLIEDLQARIDQSFRPQPQVKEQLGVLLSQKEQLNRYAELMGSRLGNMLGKSIHEVFWAAERRRQELGNFAERISKISFSEAPSWAFDRLENLRSKVEAIAQLYAGIGDFGEEHPWWGFDPRLMSPGDEIAVLDIISASLRYADELVAQVQALVEVVGAEEVPATHVLQRLNPALQALRDPPHGLIGALLPRFFPKLDARGQRSGKLLHQLYREMGRARERLERAGKVLHAHSELSGASIDEAWKATETLLASAAIAQTVADWQTQAVRIAQAVARFAQSCAVTPALYTRIDRTSLTGLQDRLEKLAVFNVRSASLEEIDALRSAVFSRCKRLLAALEKITDLAKRRSLPFDATPATVASLAGPDCIPELLSSVTVDEAVIAEASRMAQGPFCGFTLDELRAKSEAFKRLHANVQAARVEVSTTAQRIGVRIADTEDGLRDFMALVSIARGAPQDLLDYRQASYGARRFGDLALKAEEAKVAEAEMRMQLESVFHLDALPEIADIDSAITVFRRGDGLFNFLSREWRTAKRLFKGLAKEKSRRSAAECEKALSNLSHWLKHRTRFEENPDYRAAFGGLFQGLDTDLEKVRRLHGWYGASRALLDARPVLSAQVNLTEVDAGLLAQIAARADLLERAVETIADAHRRAGEILALGDRGGVSGAAGDSYSELLAFIQDADKQLLAPVDFFARLVRPSVSPARGVELLYARVELTNALPELQLLQAGSDELVAAGGRVFENLRKLPCPDWRSYLEQVRTVCANVQGLIDYLKEYVTPAATPSQAEQFMEAKLALDASVSGFGAPDWASGAVNWAEYAGRATRVGETAGRVAGILEGHGTSEATVSALVGAIRLRDEGRQIIAALDADSDTRNLIGEFFAGENSDLEGFLETHQWGSEVVALGEAVPPALRHALLSAEAATMLREARVLVAKAAASYERLRAELDKLTAYGPFDWDRWQVAVRPVGGLDYAHDIKLRLERARDGIGELVPWSKYLSLKEECAKTGLDGLVAEMEAKHLPATAMGAAFEFLAYQSIAKNIYRSYPELARFSGNSHEKLRQDFINLDRHIIDLTGREFAYSIDKSKKVPQGTTGVRAADYTGMALLRRELNKNRRHIPIRQLVRRAGKALQELKPCFMMGPLSVAQYLEPGSVEFDLVIMDEASQLRPEDALGAVARGKQLVVVGDPNQLPPTSFFDRLTDGDDEEGEEAPTVATGMESILDICQQLFHPARTLRWHYRSQHESLIAFSNHHFYRRNLIVFPSPYNRTRRLGVNYRYVRSGLYQDRRNLPEAQRVVDAVLDHMLKRPEESLGIVTLNQTQRELIEELLDRKLRAGFVEGSAFMERHEADGWPFFVKNLENVQGDERDVIFISTTFGKAPGTDKVRQNFGPISRPDGWRRLNVLFTRARKRIELFTSMQPEDVVIDDSTPRGTKALREYLDFAKQGVLAETDLGDREPDSDFEVAVGNVLADNGYQIHYQLGVAGFFLDIAVRNPDRPGEFLAGVECDGATYHSSFSARDRDRIRQQILESLGWRGRIYRIWSTDWLAEPQKQTRKLLAFLEQRRLAAAAQVEQPIEEDEEQSETEEQPIRESATAEPAGFDAGDVFVEVGDRVTYCFVDHPADKHTVLIVDSESNPRLNILNENTPVAKTLLGLCAGEENTLQLPGQPPRVLKVVKIHRDEELVG